MPLPDLATESSVLNGAENSTLNRDRSKQQQPQHQSCQDESQLRQQGDSPVLGQSNKSGRRELCSALDQRKPADEQLDSPSCEQPDLSDSSHHLDRILVRQCREPGDLLAVVEGLMPQLLLALLSVKAIFIDSMAQPFR